MIRVGSIFRGLPKKGFPSIKNINRKLHGEGAEGVRLDIDTKFQDALDSNPQIFEQFEQIDAALNNPYIEKKVRRDTLASLFTYNSDQVKEVWGEVDSLKRSDEIVGEFKAIGGLEGNFNTLKSYMKDNFRAAEHGFNQSYWMLETNFMSNAINKVPENLRGEAKTAFYDLLGDTPHFKESYGLSQDDFVRTLMGVDDARVTGHPVLGPIRQAVEQLDNDTLKYVQDLGVPVGQFDDFFLPFSIPKDAPYRLNMEELLREVVEMDDEQIRHLVGSLFARADDTTERTGMRFNARKIKFKSPDHEIYFYRKLNYLTEEAPLLQQIIKHKKNIVRKASLIANFGMDPQRTMNRAIDELSYGADFRTLDEARQLKKNFQHLMDAYSGNLNVTNHSVEMTRVFLSRLGSIATSSSSLGFIRNMLLDNNFSLQSAGNAAYNPQYGVGAASLGVVKDFAHVFKGFARANKREKAFATELLNAMEFSNSADGINFQGLMNYEDIYDLGGKTRNNLIDKVAHGAGYYNNKIYSISGQHDALDFRRFRHLVSLSNMWTNLLKNYSYKEWFDSLDGVGQNQLNHLRRNYGLGEKEFEFIKNSKFERIGSGGKELDLITRENILDISEDIAARYKRDTETAKAFKVRVANSWRKLVYLSTGHATPTPLRVDSVSQLFKNANSWTRLMISPFLKFMDIAHAQWAGVVERAALTMYGDMRHLWKWDLKSPLKYGQTLATYTGVAMGVKWAHDMLRGQKPTDFTQPEEALRAMAGSGFLGSYAMIASLGSGVPSYSRSSGLYSQTPAGSLIQSGGKVYRAWERAGKDGNWDRFNYILAEETRKRTGFGNLWWNRGLTSKLLEAMLLSPPQRRQLQRARDRARNN